MANKSPSHKFPEKNTIAKDSGNMKRKRLRKSPLRKTLAKLQELEPHALKLIEKSVKEETVDREALNTSRWIVTNLMSLTKAAIGEEAVINDILLKLDAAETEENEEKEEQDRAPTGAVFSLFVNDAKSKDKE